MDNKLAEQIQIASEENYFLNDDIAKEMGKKLEEINDDVDWKTQYPVVDENDIIIGAHCAETGTTQYLDGSSVDNDQYARLDEERQCCVILDHEQGEKIFGEDEYMAKGDPRIFLPKNWKEKLRA